MHFTEQNIILLRMLLGWNYYLPIGNISYSALPPVRCLLFDDMVMNKHELATTSKEFLTLLKIRLFFSMSKDIKNISHTSLNY
jgi:hypothetical protein